jgi:hypothetical protein
MTLRYPASAAVQAMTTRLSFLQTIDFSPFTQNTAD